jgi:predicted transglutaminase-like cysteine proteinase
VMTEEWLVGPKLGDCNDYAVTRRPWLLARGWPSGAVLLSEVVNSQGKHHLVVVIRSREGDFVWTI